MKKYIKFCNIVAATAFFALSMLSCDDYLDIVPKGKTTMTKVDQYALLFNGQSMTQYNTSGINSLTDNDWGSPILYIRAMDLSNSQLTFADPQQTPRLQWYQSGNSEFAKGYARINQVANFTLDNIGSATGDEALRTQTIAEAKALRAFSYFVMINLYAKHYDPNTADKEQVLPYYVHYNLETLPQIASVKQIYDLIESDIEEAIPNLSNTPANPYHFSKAAAYALKAKVLLFKKDFEGAEKAAKASYDLNHYLYDYANINDLQSIVYADQNAENLYFASSVLTPSANSLVGMSPDLAELFDQTNDLRFASFFDYKRSFYGDPNGTSDDTRMDVDYAPSWNSANCKGAKYYYYNEVGLRVGDVILMLAECRARKQDYAGMKLYLDELRKKRIKGYTTASEDPTSWVEAVNIVVNERRKELLFGFNRFWDLRRLNTEPEFRHSITRTAPANPNISGNPQKTYTLPPDSYLWTIPLPQDEVGVAYPTLKYNVPY